MLYPIIIYMPKLLAIFVFLLLLSITTTPAFAGGTIFSSYADTSGWANNNGLFGRTIRVFLSPEVPCRGSQITFKFTDPQDGDYIMTGSGNATYTMQEDRGSNGCSTYAKMGSKVEGARKIEIDVSTTNQVVGFVGDSHIITVDFDGAYHADNEYNGYSYRTAITDPYSSLNNQNNNANTQVPPSATINAWILNRYKDAAGILQVMIKWGAFDGNPGTFSILGTTDKVNWETLIEGQKGPSATVPIKSNGNYFLKIHGCADKWGTCADSNVLVISAPSQNTTTSTDEKTTSVTGSAHQQDEQVNALNQKVASLEGKLAESQKKQSVLEQRISSLISFIKHLFPFFQ